MNWLGRQLRGGPSFWSNPNLKVQYFWRANIFAQREQFNCFFDAFVVWMPRFFHLFLCFSDAHFVIFLLPAYLIYRHIKRTPGYIFFIFRIFSCSRPVFFFVFARVFSLHFLRFFVVCSCFFASPFPWFARFFCVVFSHFCGLPIFFGSVNLLSLSLCQAWRFVRWITAVSLEKEHRFLHFISFFSGAHCYSEWAVHNSIIFIYTYTYKAMSIP